MLIQRRQMPVHLDLDGSRNEECDVERIDGAHWKALRPDWERLHSESETPTFFLSSTWMDAWLAVFGAGAKPFFLRFEIRNSLVGMVLICRGQNRLGPFPIRQLHINTAGEGKDSPMLEHNTILCKATHRDACTRALLGFLDRLSWDELSFGGIRRADYVAIETNCSLKQSEIWQEAPYVDLERLRSTDAPYLESVSRNSRQQIRRSMKLYQSRGELMLQQAETLEEALIWFEELVELHEAVWRERGKAGAFASPRQRAFHEHIITNGLPRGEVQILRIRSGSETLGVLYNLCHHGHISFYQSGIRYEEDNRLKPGLVCHALAIQRALDTGFREYDFLAATSDGARYKVSLSNANRQLGWVKLKKGSLRAMALDTFTQVKRKVFR